MDSSELRKAAEMAGLEISLTYSSFMVNLGEGLWMGESNPALKPYVAELLVAKVRALSCGEALEGHIALASPAGDEADFPVLATAEQRIRAAMAVLGGGE